MGAFYDQERADAESESCGRAEKCALGSACIQLMLVALVVATSPRWADISSPDATSLALSRPSVSCSTATAVSETLWAPITGAPVQTREGGPRLDRAIVVIFTTDLAPILCNALETTLRLGLVVHLIGVGTARNLVIATRIPKTVEHIQRMDRAAAAYASWTEILEMNSLRDGEFEGIPVSVLKASRADRAFSNTTLYYVSDWDLFYQCTERELLDVYADHAARIDVVDPNTLVVMSGEKNCWPGDHLHRYPPTGSRITNQMPFLNSGLWACTARGADRLWAMYKSYNMWDARTDQDHFHQLLLDDWETRGLGGHSDWPDPLVRPEERVVEWTDEQWAAARHRHNASGEALSRSLLRLDLDRSGRMAWSMAPPPMLVTNRPNDAESLPQFHDINVVDWHNANQYRPKPKLNHFSASARFNWDRHFDVLHFDPATHKLEARFPGESFSNRPDRGAALAARLAFTPCVIHYNGPSKNTGQWLDFFGPEDRIVHFDRLMREGFHRRVRQSDGTWSEPHEPWFAIDRETVRTHVFAFDKDNRFVPDFADRVSNECPILIKGMGRG